MALSAKFKRDLRKLFDQRTASMRAVLGDKGPGHPPRFTKVRVSPKLDALARTARVILLAKRGRKEFNDSYISKHQWRVTKSKGRGRSAKTRSFKQWYDRTITGHNCVYVFWSGNKCEYVGRTIRGKGRPSNSFDKFWFGSVTRLDIYTVQSPSIVHKAECLAIDIFDPRRNKNSSSRPQYAKRCPICSSEKKIRRDLKRLFPFRKKRRTRQLRRK